MFCSSDSMFDSCYYERQWSEITLTLYHKKLRVKIAFLCFVFCIVFNSKSRSIYMCTIPHTGLGLNSYMTIRKPLDCEANFELDFESSLLQKLHKSLNVMIWGCYSLWLCRQRLKSADYLKLLNYQVKTSLVLFFCFFPWWCIPG